MPLNPPAPKFVFEDIDYTPQTDTVEDYVVIVYGTMRLSRDELLDLNPEVGAEADAAAKEQAREKQYDNLHP